MQGNFRVRSLFLPALVAIVIETLCFVWGLEVWKRINEGGPREESSETSLLFSFGT